MLGIFKNGIPAAWICAAIPVVACAGGGTDFESLRQDYLIFFLASNPVVSTYLGGSALDRKLADTDGRLRDFSPASIAVEDARLGSFLSNIRKIDPKSLTDAERIDRQVIIAQLRFQLHQHQVRHYQERSLDTYVDTPFRGVDWQMQGMTPTGDLSYGTEEEWTRLVERVEAIPAYLKVAEDQLKAGIDHHNTPDWRMLRADGIDTPAADAAYFESSLHQIAATAMSGSWSAPLLVRLTAAGKAAANAYRELQGFVINNYFIDPSKPGAAGLKPEFAADNFMAGEKEYDWALHNNLHVKTTAAKLFDSAWPVVERTRARMVKLARSIAASHGWRTPVDDNGTVRAVLDKLAQDYPKDDEEMVRWYKDTALRLVEYARKTGLFQVPDNYALEVVETPPPLRASIDGAAYYPAPPFKDTGVGRFFVSPTGNDPAKLKENNRAALADLAAHEGFPGHDWHYKVMTRYRDSISSIRWLTPGAVEDSSSMWEDSMAAEGWALYAEGLMAEPRPGHPHGFYTPEERLYQLQGELYRDLRVYVDTGIHTGRISFDKAVNLFSTVVDFAPGDCSPESTAASDTKRASCENAHNAIFRYSKWPTQAITYRLGRDAIRDLRNKAMRLLGPNFSLQQFHLELMKQGTVPATYTGPEVLKALSQSAK